jgi:hypothetical protein
MAAYRENEMAVDRRGGAPIRYAVLRLGHRMFRLVDLRAVAVVELVQGEAGAQACSPPHGRHLPRDREISTRSLVINATTHTTRRKRSHPELGIRALPTPMNSADGEQ